VTTSNPVRRIAAIVDVVAGYNKGITLVEIANATRLSPSTAHRTVNILLDVGYLVLDPSTKTYRIGQRLKRVLLLSHGSGPLEDFARPALISLSEQFSETSYLVRFSGRRIHLSDYHLPTTGSRTLVHPGFDFPMHATAAGKVVFAYLSDDIIENELTRDLEHFMPNTITSQQKIRQELAKVKTQGYAVNDAELDPGVYAVAAPVFLSDGETLIGAMAIAGIRDRLLENHSETEIANQLLEATSDLSRLIDNINVLPQQTSGLSV
jgi:DNA-binding IclR family transcriptional regulator